MSKSSKSRRVDITPYIGMLLGVCIGIGSGNVGLGMLGGLTIGLLYENYEKKKESKNSL